MLVHNKHSLNLLILERSYPNSLSLIQIQNKGQ